VLKQELSRVLKQSREQKPETWTLLQNTVDLIPKGTNAVLYLELKPRNPKFQLYFGDQFCVLGERDMFWFGCSRQQKHHTAAPPPAPVRRGMERNRQKLVGWDKGSLTEQQTKGIGTTMIQKRGKQDTNPQNRAHRTEPLSWTEPPLCPPEP